MPELPEVETMRRGIEGVQGGILAGLQTIRSPFRPISVRPAITTLRRRVVGHKIAAVERIGKRLLWRLDDGGVLVFEPRMTGLLLIADPPDTQHLRLRIVIDESPIPQVLFWDRRGLGCVYWLSAKDRALQFDADHIGPDAITITPRDLRRRLQTSSRDIKIALLDQKVLAGVGNLYASEILHRGRIHPRTPCRQLTDQQWQDLGRALRSILTRAIQYEGSTLADGTYRNALNLNGAYQHHHRVYMKAGQRCDNCQRAAIVRIVQAQRSTFYCPVCQPPAKRIS